MADPVFVLVRIERGADEADMSDQEIVDAVHDALDRCHVHGFSSNVDTALVVDEPTDLDAAMHSVWLHTRWDSITREMTTEEREATFAAIKRYSAWLNGGESDIVDSDWAWWRE